MIQAENILDNHQWKGMDIQNKIKLNNQTNHWKKVKSQKI